MTVYFKKNNHKIRLSLLKKFLIFDSLYFNSKFQFNFKTYLSSLNLKLIYSFNKKEIITHQPHLFNLLTSLMNLLKKLIVIDPLFFGKHLKKFSYNHFSNCPQDLYFLSSRLENFQSIFQFFYAKNLLENLLTLLKIQINELIFV